MELEIRLCTGVGTFGHSPTLDAGRENHLSTTTYIGFAPLSEVKRLMTTWRILALLKALSCFMDTWKIN